LAVLNSDAVKRSLEVLRSSFGINHCTAGSKTCVTGAQEREDSCLVHFSSGLAPFILDRRIASAHEQGKYVAVCDIGRETVVLK
jgi:hypothetical protein